MKKILFALMLASCSFVAMASRPFITDDARLTLAESCQLESWVRTDRESQEIWMMPACNPSGNFEMTVGGGRAKVEGEQATSDFVLQGKTLLRSMESNGWGVALSLGTIRHPDFRPGPNRLGNIFANMPLSVSFNDDRFVIHANLGWMKDKASRANSTTWGLGGEVQMNPHFLGIAEVFGDDRNKPNAQVGGRFIIVPDRVQIDTSIGKQLGASAGSRWISLGLRLTPEHFF